MFSTVSLKRTNCLTNQKIKRYRLTTLIKYISHHFFYFFNTQIEQYNFMRQSSKNDIQSNTIITNSSVPAIFVFPWFRYNWVVCVLNRPI
jgi:hypothetical protein